MAFHSGDTDLLFLNNNKQKKDTTEFCYGQILHNSHAVFKSGDNSDI